MVVEFTDDVSQAALVEIFDEKIKVNAFWSVIAI